MLAHLYRAPEPSACSFLVFNVLKLSLTGVCVPVQTAVCQCQSKYILSGSRTFCLFLFGFQRIETFSNGGMCTSSECSMPVPVQIYYFAVPPRPNSLFGPQLGRGEEEKRSRTIVSGVKMTCRTRIQPDNAYRGREIVQFVLKWVKNG